MSYLIKKNLNICFVFCRPNSDIELFNANAASMWIKALSSWTCVTIYGWSLAAPLILTDRDFS